ncbi:MAG: GAF domain-containing protein [Cystobacter sp.]
MSIEAFAKVTEASKLLVEQGFTGAAVESAIRQVGGALGVNRALVYENSASTVPGKRVAPLRHGWGLTAIPAPTRGFALQDQMAGWVEILSRGQPVWELVRNLPGAFRSGLEAQGVQSVLMCPINVGTLNGRWWGMLRMDDCTLERRWATEEVSVVKTLARSLSNALRQDMRREELERTRQELRTMMNRCATGTR